MFDRAMMKIRSVLIVAGLAFAGAAGAQDAPSTGGRAIGSIFDALGLRKPPPTPPDFVRESRPADLDYAPLAPTPERNQKKSIEKLQSTGAALDRAAAENRRRASRVNVPN